MLFPPKKPKWQHSDPKVRLAAIAEIEPIQTEVLLQIALYDAEPSIRAAAITKLDDLLILDEVAAQSSDPRIVELATGKSEEKRAALLQTAGDPDMHLEHLASIKNASTLIRLASTSYHTSIRLRCLDRLPEQGELEQVAMGQCGKSVAEVLVERLDDQEILTRLAQHGGNKFIKRLCAEKLIAQRQREAAGKAEHAEERSQQILDTARRLSTSLEWDLVRQRLAQLKTEWESLDGSLQHGFGKQFYETIDHFESRYADHISARKRQQQQEEQLLKEQFSETLQQIRRLSPSDNIASVALSLKGYRTTCEDLLEKLPAAMGRELHLELTEACRQFDDRLVRYEQEHQKAAEYEARFNQKKETVQEPAQLLEELESLLREIESAEWQQFEPKALKDKISIEKTTRSGVLIQTEAEGQQQKELVPEQLARLTLELGELAKRNDMAAAMARFREIDGWFNGPEFEISDCPAELKKRYRAERARFLAKQRDFFAVEEWQRWANRNIKEKLIDEANGLETLDDFASVFAKLKKLQLRWKETGKVVAKDDRKLWLRFHELCEGQFNRCRPYLEELEKIRQQQVERYNAIVEEAKALSGSDSWQTTAGRFRAWQNEIKEFTAVPAETRRDLHLLFRREANSFFERRRQHQQEIEREQEKNYRLKEALCQEAEKLAATPEPNLSKEFRRLQKEWKGIAPVSRKKEQQLWQRFRKACDQFFQWQDDDRKNNLVPKSELIDKAAAIAAQAETADDFRSLAEEMTALQNRWKEIGPLPKAESQPMWERFRSEVRRFYSIRQRSLSTLQGEKRENQRRKEGILEEIERLAGSIQDKEATEKIKGLQKQFHAVGPSPKGEDQHLRQRLQTLCDNFFKGRSSYFAQLRENRDKILLEKETLIFELQQLVNYSPKRMPPKGPRTLDLAMQLKLALEGNFAMAERDKHQARREEVNRIQKKWKALEKLPFGQERELQKRFQEALDYHERQNRRK